MDERAARQRVVTIAREWIGTPYRHGARIKGVAADCTFFAKVYEEAGLCPQVEIAPYSSMAHLHRASGQYLLHIRRYARETSAPKPGDIAMFHIARDFSHGGVINAHGWPGLPWEKAEGWPWIIHAEMMGNGGLVYEACGDQASLAQAKAVKFFTLWG